MVNIVVTLVLMGALVGLPGDGWAQSFGGHTQMHVQREADPPRNGLQAVCGRVFNDRQVTATRVRIQLDGLDANGRVIRSREAETTATRSPRPAIRASRTS
jgi:hypothetical protein